MKIKKAILKDLPVIVKLWVEFMKDHDKIVLKRNKKLKPYTDKINMKSAGGKYRKFVRESIKSKKGAVFIAEVDGVAVGFTLVLIKDEISVFKIKKLGHVTDLFVKEEFRGRKISSGLMSEARKWLKSKGMKYMSIGLYFDNRNAHSVYKKWGFMDFKLEMRRKV
ncbi:GNAT family N-acetyltransferase [Nanoarchaeota archaeon]